MAKPKLVRGKFADEKYLGPEPDLSGTPSRADLANAYNWYNYFYDADSAKEFVLAFLKEKKTDKDFLKKVNKINVNDLRNIGWNCRILLLGGKLPKSIMERTLTKLKALANETSTTSEGNDENGNGSTTVATNSDSGERSSETPAAVKNVVSIQDRVASKTSELIGELELELDKLYNDSTYTFKPADWLRNKDVKPAIAAKLADYYKPLYSEYFDALQGKDPELKEGYNHLTKKQLKIYVEFVKSIISDCGTRSVVVKAVRKPRKKKEKPVTEVVGKLKYQEADEKLNLTSEKPTAIVGANQLWIFNTKTRSLSVFNAMGPSGLGVKGTTVTGFDEKTSVTKKLRKPGEQLHALKEGGKVTLRKFMDGIKCKAKPASGRINTDTILVRIIK